MATTFSSAAHARPGTAGGLVRYLETVEVERDARRAPFRLPVQWVNRPDLDFRGFCGTIASGSVAREDEVAVLPSGRTSRVKDIVTADGTSCVPLPGRRSR